MAGLRPGRANAFVALAAWVALVVLALGALTAYSFAAGPPARLVNAWPAESHIPHAEDRPTLLMFVHPECPCTRASLSTLRVALGASPDRARAYLVFRGSDAERAAWEQREAWALQGLPVRVITDTDGSETLLFGAKTSGHVSLYDVKGSLLFEGGVTPGRGHMGDNPQLTRLRAVLDGVRPPAPSVPGAVYGCTLAKEVP